MACCRAGAEALGVPLCRHINGLARTAVGGGEVKMCLPVPCLNVINGGVHAGNALAFQEFFLIPSGASSFAEAMRLGAETYAKLKKVIEAKYGKRDTGVGDEGGFAPNISSPEEGMSLLMEAIEGAGHGGKIELGSDPAASEFYSKEKGAYDLGFKCEEPNVKTAQEMVALYQRICGTFPMALLEVSSVAKRQPLCAASTDAVSSSSSKRTLSMKRISRATPS